MKAVNMATHFNKKSFISSRNIFIRQMAATTNKSENTTNS